MHLRASFRPNPSSGFTRSASSPSGRATGYAAAVKILARYRRHSESDATTHEVVIEAADYDAGLAEARGRAAEGDDLLSVLVVD